MTAQTYRTSAGDVLDEIAWRQYGAGDAGTLAILLAANPGLADRGPVLPAGLLITLPEIAAPTREKKAVVLWE